MQETDLFIPVDIGEVPEGLTIIGPQVNGIELRVSGSKKLIETLPDLNLRYLLDVSKVNIGANPISIDLSRIPLPKGISPISLHPSFLTVRVENEIKKELPVAISFSGNPVEGFFVASAVSQPSSVILRGPKPMLDSIEKIFTKPINLRGLSESFKIEIPLDLAENLYIISSSTIILAEISIEEEIIKKKFENIPVVCEDTSYNCLITPPTINIEVKGPTNILKKLQIKNDIKVYLDLKNLKPGVYARRAAIMLPLKMVLVSVKPEIFTVKISN
ncbi:MAG: hypothetical protein JW786_06145 [Desulfobacterales bacterium]|nr:hypothetical protein [Desulfobacterales bacterium]